jgi:hypothetical protein
MILPETHRSQVQHFQESPKFRSHPDGGFLPNPFPGYTIITPTGSEDPDNTSLYTNLTHYQQELVQQLGADRFAPVPPDSFHLTLADLIWGSTYYHVLEENPDFETKLRSGVDQIFQQCQAITEGKAIQFHALGLLLMPRAIALCMVPTEESSYDRILKFRRAVYQNHDLIGLGIEQQYYFTPHITLGYVGAAPAAEEYVELGDRLVALNHQWLDQGTQDFWVKRAELRKFDTMNHYYREPDWAVLEF